MTMLYVQTRRKVTEVYIQFNLYTHILLNILFKNKKNKTLRPSLGVHLCQQKNDQNQNLVKVFS